MFNNKRKDIEIEQLKVKIAELEKREVEKESFYAELEKMIEHIENGFLMYQISARYDDQKMEFIKIKLILFLKIFN